MNLIIKHATVFTNDDDNRMLADHAVVIEGASIREIVPSQDASARYAKYEQIDAGGKLVMPGFINVHMHFYGTFARGMAVVATPRNFPEILSMLWWKLDSALDLESIYYSTIVPAISAIKSGITAVIDHHASPQAVEGSLDKVEEAMDRVGLRGILCYEVSDRDGKPIRDLGLQENARYISKCEKAREKDAYYPHDGMVGLHASFTLDDDSLNQAAELCQTFKRGCHIHMLEGSTDAEQTWLKYKSRVVERLQRHCILGPKTIAAHAIYLDEFDMDVLAQTGSIVAHNPQSNMNNAVGRSDIFGLLRRGILLGLGTDGMTPDIKPDVRAGYLMHKHHLHDSNVGWNEIQQMLFKNNPAIYRRLTGQKVGRIEPGYLADMIVVDYYPPTPLSSENFWGHFLFGIIDAAVDTSIINGKIVMRDRQLLQIDEAMIAAASNLCAQRVWKRLR